MGSFTYSVEYRTLTYLEEFENIFLKCEKNNFFPSYNQYFSFQIYQNPPQMVQSESNNEQEYTAL